MELGEKGTLRTRNEEREDLLTAAQNYLVADKPGAKVSFPFSTKLGVVELHYLRSAIFGLGSVKCWVDDDVDHVEIIEGYWDLEYNIARLVVVAVTSDCSALSIPGRTQSGTTWNLETIYYTASCSRRPRTLQAATSSGSSRSLGKSHRGAATSS